MSQVKLALRELTPDQKIQLAREIVAAMTGNGNFTAPNPPLTTITALADNLQAAVTAQKAAQQAALMATLALRAAEAQLDTSVTGLGAWVQNISGGSESVILSAGMGVKSDNTPVGILPAPEALSASLGDMPGEIDLHWSRVPHANSYVLQHTTDPLTPASTWTTMPPVTKSKTSVANLAAGTRYWFRVATVSTAGQGPWSDPATKMAQ